MNGNLKEEVIDWLAVEIASRLLGFLTPQRGNRIITTRRIVLSRDIDQESYKYNTVEPMPGAVLKGQQIIYETHKDPDDKKPPICVLLVITSWDCPEATGTVEAVALDAQPHGANDPPCA